MLTEWLTDYVVFLRNELDDPADRSDNYVQTETVSNQSEISFEKNRVKNVYYVKEDDVLLNYGSQYDVDYEDEKIVSLYGDFDGDVEIEYDYGSTWIYPEFPRLEDVTLPRVSIKAVGPVENVISIGNCRIMYRMVYQTDIWVDDETVYDYQNGHYSGPSLRDIIEDNIYKSIRNKRSWVPNVKDTRLSTASHEKEEVGDRNIFRSVIDVRMDYYWSC